MGLTFAKWVDQWIEQRKVDAPLAYRDDSSRLRHHATPHLGDRSLEWLAQKEGTAAAHAWAKDLKNHLAQRDGKPLAPNSVKNAYSIVRVLFDDAVEAGHMDANPLAHFRARKHLPPKGDKDAA